MSNYRKDKDSENKIPPLSKQEEREMFASYDAIVQVASKPFDLGDERFLYETVELDTEFQDKCFEDELPPTLFEVENRLKGDMSNHRNYLPIQALRQARHLSQKQLANFLHIEPTHLFQLENSIESNLGTLRRYIEAMGGELDIIAHFPDGEIRIDSLIKMAD